MVETDARYPPTLYASGMHEEKLLHWLTGEVIFCGRFE